MSPPVTERGAPERARQPGSVRARRRPGDRRAQGGAGLSSGQDRGQRVGARGVAAPARRWGRAGPRGVVECHRDGVPSCASAVLGVSVERRRCGVHRAVVGHRRRRRRRRAVATRGDLDGLPGELAPSSRQMAGQVNVLGYDVRKLQRWIRLTGGAPGHSGKDPTAHILWIRDTEPDVYRATYKFLEPVDWLNQRLTGRFSASYDSIAAHWVTDNRHINSIDYDDTLLRMSGLERSKLPDIVPSATIMGSLPARGGRGARPSCRASRWRPGPATCTPPRWGRGRWPTSTVTSTSGRRRGSRATCRSRRPTPCDNVASIPAAIPGRYLVADEHETAGACLTFLAENVLFDQEGPGPSVGDGNVYRYFDEVAAQVAPGSHGAHVHAVAQRRALAGGRSHHSGRVPQPVALHIPRRPGARRVRGGGAQQPVAARCGGTFRRTAGSSRWRSSGGVPTPRSGPRSTPTPRVAGSVRSSTPSSPTCEERGS